MYLASRGILEDTLDFVFWGEQPLNPDAIRLFLIVRPPRHHQQVGVTAPFSITK